MVRPPRCLQSKCHTKHRLYPLLKTVRRLERADSGRDPLLTLYTAGLITVWECQASQGWNEVSYEVPLSLPKDRSRLEVWLEGRELVRHAQGCRFNPFREEEKEEEEEMIPPEPWCG